MHPPSRHCAPGWIASSTPMVEHSTTCCPRLPKPSLTSGSFVSSASPTWQADPESAKVPTSRSFLILAFEEAKKQGGLGMNVSTEDFDKVAATCSLNGNSATFNGLDGTKLTFSIEGNAWKMDSAFANNMVDGIITSVGGIEPTYKFDVTMVKPIENNNLTYADDNIAVAFSIGDTSVSMSILNKTDKSIKLNWDEVQFVRLGESQRVIHEGTKLVDRNSPQAPSTIAPGARVDDSITPSNNIYYEEGDTGSWKYHKLFPSPMNDAYKGSEFSVFLPLDISGKRQEYNFVFRINSVTESFE